MQSIIAQSCDVCPHDDDSLSNGWCRSPNCYFDVIDDQCKDNGKCLITFDMYSSMCITFWLKKFIVSFLLYLHTHRWRNLEEYVTVYGITCYGQLDQKYYTVQTAYDACSSDSRCFGILDGNCDMSGSFDLCIASTESSDDIHTCMYRKQEMHGTLEFQNL